MQELWTQVTQVVGPYLPRIIAAAAFLVAGWLVAMLIAGIVRGLLRRTTIDDRIAQWIAGEEQVAKIDLETWIGKAVYYLLMVFALIGFFQILGLTLITEPLNRFLEQVFGFAPRLLGGGVLLFIAWALATVLRLVVRRALGATNIDEKLSNQAGLTGKGRPPISETLADALYWLVFLLFLPAVLGALGMEGILEPVQSMMNEALGFLPNLIAAALTLVVGWLVARIVRRVVTNLLAAAGADGLGEKVGLATVVGGQKLSGLAGLVVYVLILVPVLVASLNAIGLDSVTVPVSNMLNMLLSAIPSVFGALLILVIAFVLGRLAAALVTTLLGGIGFNSILVRLSLAKEEATGERTPASVAGSLVLVAVMLFAVMEAARMMGFGALADLLVDFLNLAGHVILGVVIFGLGLFLANLAARAIGAAGGPQATLLSTAARVAILLLTGAMALRQMGLANEIINLAFGLILGAAAVAFAIAFGLGGREAASRQVEGWISSLRSGSN